MLCITSFFFAHNYLLWENHPEVIKKNPRINLVDLGALISPQIVYNNPYSLIHGEKIYSQGRYSDFRLILLTASSQTTAGSVTYCAAFVPGHSGGPVPDFKRVPCYAHY
jgi:hypothetical protein